MIKLSHRLQAICDMVEPGSRICDVGCDHALVDIRLLQEGKITSALAMDVGDGPLETARTNLELTELSDRCELRKSDGLAGCLAGEADTMICTGMGGILMRSILEAEPEKAASFRRMILSPQSEIGLVREGLRKDGIGVEDETFLEEDGKYYTVMRAVPGGSTVRPDWDSLAEMVSSLTGEEASALQIDQAQLGKVISDSSFRRFAEDRFGPCILKYFLEQNGPEQTGRHAETSETFYRFLAGSIRTRMAVMQELAGVSGSENAAARLQEIRGETGILQVLLAVRAIAAAERGKTTPA